MHSNRALPSNGFTLLELVFGLGVVAVLSAVSLPLYLRYVERAELARLLTQIDQISTAVQIEDATGVKALQQGAVPGKAPRPARGAGQCLQRARRCAAHADPGPSWFFCIVARPGAVWPGRRLDGQRHQFAAGRVRQALPFGPGDKLWLGEGQLAFPLSAPVDAAKPGSTSPPSGPPPPQAQTRWDGQAIAGPRNTWSCLAKLYVYGTDALPLQNVKGSMRVRTVLEVTTRNGEAITRSKNVKGKIVNGVISLRMDRLSASPSNGEVVTACRLEVLGIDYNPPGTPSVPWDGKLATIRLPMPGSKP